MVIFATMHVRMIPKSTSSLKFADVATISQNLHVKNVTGTIVGFWTPEMFHNSVVHHTFTLSQMTTGLKGHGFCHQRGHC